MSSFDLAQKILSFAVYLSQVEKIDYAVEQFADVINDMGLGFSLGYKSGEKEPETFYIPINTKEKHNGYFVVEPGSLNSLSEEQSNIIYNGVKLLALILEYKSNNKKLKSNKKQFNKIVASKTVEVVKAQALTKIGSWSFKIPNRAIEWSNITYGIFGVAPDSITPTVRYFISHIIRKDRAAVKKHLRTALTALPGSKLDSLTFGIIRPDGDVRYVTVLIDPVFDASNNLIRVFGTIQDVTKQKLTELALLESRNLLRSILDTAPMWIAAFDTNGQYLAANKYFGEICGLPLKVIENSTVDHVLPETFLERHMDLIEKCIGGEVVRFNDKLLKGEFDDAHYIAGNYAPLLDGQDNVIGVVGAINDVSDLVETREELQKTESELHRRLDDLRLYGEVFEHTAEGIIITDADKHVLKINKAIEDMFGYEIDDLIGKSPSIWKCHKQGDSFGKSMWEAIEKTGEWHGEVWGKCKDESLLPSRVAVNAIKNARGEVVNYISIISDITNLKESQERLDYLAHHDPLTDLPNRLLFNARLEHAVKHAYRKKGKLALLFLDLDNFKIINDDSGHAVGDELLKAVSERLMNTVRMDDAVARNGGDEFTVLVEDIDDPADAALVAEKVIDAFLKPFEFRGVEYYISTSIGISIYPNDASTPDGLIRNADIAMYRAKGAGNARYAFYTEDMTTVAFERVLMEAGLKKALERDEFVLHFQPQVEVSSGKIVGIETLLRWEHPEMGTLEPQRFLSQAEDTGLSSQLSEWVLKKALSQGKLWIDQGRYNECISINISEAELNSDCFEQKIVTLLEVTGYPPYNLELEVKESAFINNSGQAISALERLKKRGISIAIDNYGLGYSSLSKLKFLPVDKLKIDRSFIKDLPGDETNFALTKAVISLASSLGLKVTAEGVETEMQKEFLLDDGYCAGQGFYFHRPMSKEELECKFDA